MKSNKGQTVVSLFLKILLLCFLPKGTFQGPNERRLLHDLLENYNAMERPVQNETEPVFVSFGLTLQQLIDVDEKNQVVITNIMINMEWVDSNLRWNVSDYGGITDIRIAASKIWKPDILLYNSADEKIDSTFPANVIVRNNGSCVWLPPGIFKSTCKIDITWFPFDEQNCRMKFGSWTYTASSLDLRLHSEAGGDLSTYIENGEWILLDMPGVRNVVEYECCPEAYLDLTFYINIRRRTLYYGFNLIIPCMIISSMVLLGFTLPPESGEKLTLGVTILLSMSVFMLQLTDTLPPTSESVSIIGTYFACIMIVVACSVVMTVVVLNFHHRTTEFCEMPHWVKVLVLNWLPYILRMSRPGVIKPPKKTQASPSVVVHHKKNVSPSPGIATIKSHIKEFGGVLPTLVDVDEDYRAALRRHYQSTGACTCSLYDQVPNYSRLSASGTPLVITQPSAYPCDGGEPIIGNHCRQPVSSVKAGHQLQPLFDEMDHNNLLTSTTNAAGRDKCCGQSPSGGSTVVSSNSLSLDLNSILKELRFITNRMRREDELSDIIQEWKFAGMVIDRICLIVFTTFTVISTVVCLSSAPHLIT